MRAAGMKRRTRSISKLKERPVRVQTAEPNARYYRKNDISSSERSGRKVWTIAPQNAFLFSWRRICLYLDVSMSNPALPELDKRDPILDIQGLKTAGEMYAGDLSVRDPRVSSMFGDCSNLAPVSLFIGTRDIFLADCRDFRTKLTAEGIRLDYHEAPEMLHDWMIMPTPEAEEVLSEIQSILQ
jgi:hypothetical protein